MYRLCRIWRLINCAPLALGAALFASAPQPAGDGRPTIAISGVTVIDVVTGRLRSGVSVVTEGERIVAIGPSVAIPHGATRVSGKGRFLIPGLWDMHSHH